MKPRRAMTFSIRSRPYEEASATHSVLRLAQAPTGKASSVSTPCIPEEAGPHGPPITVYHHGMRIPSDAAPPVRLHRALTKTEDIIIP